MKAKKQKAFWKCENALIDRFSDPHELLLYVQLRCLAGSDREGRIWMDTDALAARLKWPLEHLAPVLARLMEPDPKSRCQLAEGRTVAFIDENRPELGFWIPAVRRHRKRNADTERRRAEKAAWLRENRRSRAKDPANPQRGKGKLGKTGEDSGSQKEDSGSLPSPGQIELGKTREVSGSQKEVCDSRYKKEDVLLNSKSGGSTLQSPEPSNCDWPLTFDRAQELINRDVLSNAVTKKMWSRQALENLLELMPSLTEDHIFTVGFYWTHERNPKMPELDRRPSFGLEKILEHWLELLVKAIAFDKHHYPSSIRYPNPLG